MTPFEVIRLLEERLDTCRSVLVHFTEKATLLEAENAELRSRLALFFEAGETTEGEW